MAKWKQMAQAQDDLQSAKKKNVGSDELVMYRVPGSKFVFIRSCLLWFFFSPSQPLIQH
jgi:hypothetical protein